jgi:hypothetical protein
LYSKGHIPRKKILTIAKVLNSNFFGLAKAIYYKNMFIAGFDYGYKSNLLTLAKSDGFVVLIFTSPITIKKNGRHNILGSAFSFIFRISRYMAEITGRGLYGFCEDKLLISHAFRLFKSAVS